MSKDAILDIQENGELYTIQVQALDRGKPFGQSSEATISVQIEDVNDKSPMCQKDSFTMYVLESIPVGKYFLYFSPKDYEWNYDVLEIKPCGQINSLYKTNIEEGQKVHWKVKICTNLTKKKYFAKFWRFFRFSQIQQPGGKILVGA